MIVRVLLSRIHFVFDDFEDLMAVLELIIAIGLGALAPGEKSDKRRRAYINYDSK